MKYYHSAESMLKILLACLVERQGGAVTLSEEEIGLIEDRARTDEIFLQREPGTGDFHIRVRERRSDECLP